MSIKLYGQPLTITPTFDTGNAATTVVYDSTSDGVSSTSPGPKRGHAAGCSIRGTLVVGDQAVTGRYYALIGGAWVEKTEWATTYLASSQNDIDIGPLDADCRFVVENGASGPDSLSGSFIVDTDITSAQR